MPDAQSPHPVPRSSGASTPPMQLLGHWRNLTCTHLDPCVSTLLDRADDALFRLAEKAEDNRTQTLYFDAMRELRRKRSTLESDYSTHIMQLFDRLLRNAGPFKQAAVAIDTDELSLVGTEELEENLAIDGMVAKARRAHDGELATLQRACGQIMNRTLSAESLPVDPQALCHAFREAMQVIDVDIKVRLIIYKLFEQHVLSELSTLYQEILRYLQQRQIVPASPQSSHERAASSAFASREPRSTPQDFASPSKPAIHDTPADSGSDLLALFQQLSQLHRVSTPAAAAREDPPRTVSAALPETANVPQISAEQLSGALSCVATQLLPTQALPQGQHFSGAQLKQAVMGALPVGTGQSPPMLNHVDETSIDIVSMLFDFIFDDPALPAPVKALIGRLQIPVLKAAILDKSFFSQKRHPARRLLNELTRAGLSWNEADEHDDGLLAKITEIVEKLQQDFDQDSTLFDEALGDFLDFCEHQAQRAAQREEQTAAATQNREQLLLAKGIAAEAIERIIEAHPRLPDPVLRLLRTTWKDLLVLIYIKNGQHGTLWQKALNVASLLVWSLLPKNLPKEREQLAELLPSLRKALQEGMQRMGVNEAEQQTLYSVLAHEHGRMVRSSNAPTPADAVTPTREAEHSPTPPLANAMPQTPPATLPKATAEQPPQAPHDGRSFMARKVSEINQLITEGRFQVYAEVASTPVPSEATDIEDMYLLRVKELNEGTWLELLDEANQPLRAKLSWKSLISGKYFFVNRQGLKVREMSIHELAHEFRSGRTRIIEDLPVFDRAVSTLMASLRKDDS